MMMVRPQTLGYGLSDSPAGLADLGLLVMTPVLNPDP